MGSRDATEALAKQANSPRRQERGPGWAARRRKRIRRIRRLAVDLLGEVLLFADLFDDVELGFEPIHAFFLIGEDAFEQLTRTVVGLLSAQCDGLVEPIDRVDFHREVELVLLDGDFRRFESG